MVLSPPGLAPRLLADRRQAGAALGYQLVAEDTVRLICTQGHTCINVDFAETGLHKQPYQSLRLFHGGLRVFFSPDQRAQMVAAQNQIFPGHTHFVSQLADPLCKVLRLHSGIAAKLVDLIGSRFNQNRNPLRFSIGNGRANHIFIGTAHGVNTYALPRALQLHKRLQLIFHIISRRSVPHFSICFPAPGLRPVRVLFVCFSISGCSSRPAWSPPGSGCTPGRRPRRHPPEPGTEPDG